MREAGGLAGVGEGEREGTLFQQNSTLFQQNSIDQSFKTLFQQNSIDQSFKTAFCSFFQQN
jgi:hypothetical protein